MNTSKVNVVFLAALAAVSAQTFKGSIGGRITDADNKAISAARITLASRETGKVRATNSDADGQFAVWLLAPGGYKLEVEREGYRKHVQPLELLVNQEIRIDVPLLPGQRTEEIVVTATRGLLKTESSALGAVIENRQVRGLPLDGRNFFELSLLVPGAAPAAQGSAGSVRGDLALHFNGAREDSNNFLLDGVYNGDAKLNTFGVKPPVDAIQEFEVLTSGYDASFGRNAGGQVNVVTKSGGNQVHGSAYEFFRHAAMDSRNYFAPAGEPSPKYQRNQFGGSLGGPLRKDRTFFFGDYEGLRLREGITRVTNVPTAQERRGDFSQSPRPLIDPFTQQPFPGNRIPQERLHPIGLGIAFLYPLPNRQVPGQNFVSSPALRDRDDHFDARIDHALSASSEITARYSFADRTLFDPFSGPSFALVPGYGTDVPRRAQNAMLAETHIFSPSLMNEVRLAFNRVAGGSFQQNQGKDINRAVGLPGLASNPRDLGLSFITVTGYSPLGDEYNNPQHGVTNTYQVVDQASYAHGRHLARFGFDYRALQQNAYRDVQSRGFLNFLGQTGNALSELLQGLVSVSGGARLDNPQHLRVHSYGFFAQDTFRVRPDLTLTAGMRYEYNSPGVDTQDRANLYDVASQRLVAVGKDGFPRGGYEPDRNNFGPRLGLAWTPGRGNTVLRGGYGLYYDQSALAPSEGLYFSPPYFDFKLYFSLPPQVVLLLHDPFPKNFPFPLPSSALAFQRDLRTSYIQHWNFSVQRQVGMGRVVELAYVGSKGTRLLSGRDINQPRPSPRQPNPRPVLQFDDINRIESRGNSSYNSLQARLQQRVRGGLSLLASYTWSKSLDDASSFFPSAGDPSYAQDSYNARAERGRSGFDQPHRLSAAYSYDLPIAKGHRWLGGWQTFGILTLQTGRPFTVALMPELDNSNTGRSILGFGANDRPNLVGAAKLDARTPERWFNTAAFELPPYGSFGNAGRNILDGPGLATLNASIVKDTRVGERLNLQFRAEAFNLFNRTNFDLPDNFVGSPTFGAIRSAGSPRHVQLGLKLLF
ncbi:MAG: TonB-dependent receptor [Candidatus Solibacter usitatus]|nr:TonB-dependent receptor [Candidatus Solibacter usitatus]